MRDLTGQKFGRLTAIRKDMTRPHLTGRGYYWLCECECGNTKSVLVGHLTTGMVKSCGCMKGRPPKGRTSKTPSARVAKVMKTVMEEKSGFRFDLEEMMPSRIAEAYYW